MGLIAKIKEIIFKVKDYDRLESDYCTVLDMVTGARLSKPNYTMDSVREAFNEFLDEHDKQVYKPAKTVEKILKRIEKDATWIVISVYKNGKRKPSYVHRLVANAFLGVNNEMTVNHKDENKTNNNIENLEYLTRGDNIRYSARRHKKERVGTSHNSIPVNQYTLDGNFVARYESANLTANNVGLKRNLTILMCCRRERNVAGGYLWRFDGDTDLSHGHIMRQRKVMQFDLEGNFLAKFDTIKEAALLTNTNNGHISSCCCGKIKTANGFRWMYEEDYNNLKQSQHYVTIREN